MNAGTIINDDMTLEEKMKAIDLAMLSANEKHLKEFPGEAPLDPANLTMCEGCQ